MAKIRITDYIVSDTHLADGGRRDDFKKNRDEFKKFLHFIQKQKARLTIAGDFLELWQTNPVAIAGAYSDILNELIAMRARIVIGNHDYYLTHFRKLKFLCDSCTIPGTRIIIKHGHQFDRFNDPERLMRLARLAALSGAVMEDIHPDLDDKAMDFLQQLRKNLNAALRPTWAPGTQTKKYLSQGGNFSEYLRGAQALLKKYDCCILGHTHRPGTAFGGRYINSGSWTSKKPTYVEVDANAHCTLRYWPSRRPLKNVLDKSRSK